MKTKTILSLILSLVLTCAYGYKVGNKLVENSHENNVFIQKSNCFAADGTETSEIISNYLNREINRKFNEYKEAEKNTDFPSCFQNLDMVYKGTNTDFIYSGCTSISYQYMSKKGTNTIFGEEYTYNFIIKDGKVYNLNTDALFKNTEKLKEKLAVLYDRKKNGHGSITFPECYLNRCYMTEKGVYFIYWIENVKNDNLNFYMENTLFADWDYVYEFIANDTVKKYVDSLVSVSPEVYIEGGFPGGTVLALEVLDSKGEVADIKQKYFSEKAESPYRFSANFDWTSKKEGENYTFKASVYCYGQSPIFTEEGQSITAQGIKNNKITLAEIKENKNKYIRLKSTLMPDINGEIPQDGTWQIIITDKEGNIVLPGFFMYGIESLPYTFDFLQSTEQMPPTVNKEAEFYIKISLYDNAMQTLLYETRDSIPFSLKDQTLPDKIDFYRVNEYISPSDIENKFLDELGLEVAE
ncbi:MAG: hypothetical protein KBT47_08645 [Armatimonadetes bacterium]|nr:hypothetical protein [Candidatus Hippobium faecium]